MKLFLKNDRVDNETSGEWVQPIYESAESKEGYELLVYLPGVKKSGLHLTVDSETLVVEGRKEWKRPEGLNPIYRESNDLGYRLSIPLHRLVNPDAVKAELKDGVLTLSLPKVESVKPKKIEVA